MINLICLINMRKKFNNKKKHLKRNKLKRQNNNKMKLIKLLNNLQMKKNK